MESARRLEHDGKARMVRALPRHGRLAVGRGLAVSAVGGLEGHEVVRMLAGHAHREVLDGPRQGVALLARHEGRLKRELHPAPLQLIVC